MATRTAAIGEPWLSYFDPSELSKELRERGFQELEDLGLADIAVRYLGTRKGDATSDAGPHVICALLDIFPPTQSTGLPCSCAVTPHKTAGLRRNAGPGLCAIASTHS